jgi:predicted Rossmann fold nucleotide-binding protein DprA/Smf involved in DNA uptake
MNEHTLSADTQATLLLCGIFGSESPRAQGPSAEPLTLSEFNKFEQALSGEGLNLSTLIEADSEWLMEKLQGGGFDIERLSALLSRGAAMAVAVEQWTNVGLWILGCNDDEYPQRLKERLKQAAPPILYGAGNRGLLSCGGLAMVGSRDADEVALTFAHRVGEICAQQHIQVISGGARGVDSAAMLGALERGGTVLGILSGNLAQEVISGEGRSYLADERLGLMSPFHPKAPFTVWSAMDRNKLIYAMADFALVVSAGLNKGGTWSGATENLKKGWAPLFVRDDVDAPAGNRGLIKSGGIAMEASTIQPDVPLLEKLSVLAGARLKPASKSTESEEQLSLQWNLKENLKPSKKRKKRKT